MDIKNSAFELINLLKRINEYDIQQICKQIITCFDNKNKLLIIGNGGSAADAIHFAEELVGRYKKNRKALPALSLCEPTLITCCANDFGYESIFKRQIEALGHEGDILISFSTSGNSKNIIEAIKEANSKKIKTISFLGNKGGEAKDISDINIIVPSNNTARIQEIHQFIFHNICEYLDSKY